MDFKSSLVFLLFFSRWSDMIDVLLQDESYSDNILSKGNEKCVLQRYWQKTESTTKRLFIVLQFLHKRLAENIW